MSKIFVVMGKSATGKDTIYKTLASDPALHLKEIVSYTTRPIRKGEQNGVEYHFVTEDDLKELQKQEKVIEHRAYNTIHGIWNYFTVNDDQIHLEKDNYIVIGTLESYLQFRKYFGEDIVQPVYIEVETGERLTRALNREKKQEHPKFEELCRRFLADEMDFSEQKVVEAGIHIRFQNKSLARCTKEIRRFILKETR